MSPNHTIIIKKTQIAITNDNTLILCQDGQLNSDYGQFIFLLSAMDAGIRRCIWVHDDGQDPNRVTNKLLVGSLGSEYQISFSTSSLYYFLWQIWNTIYYDILTSRLSVTKRYMYEVDKFVAIAPDLLCKNSVKGEWPARVNILVTKVDAFSDCLLMKPTKQYPLRCNGQDLQSKSQIGRFMNFFVDQDWIVGIDREELYVMGFDEEKCCRLKERLMTASMVGGDC